MAVNIFEFEGVSTDDVLFTSQYVVVTVCLKAGLETTAWTRVSAFPYLILSAYFPP